MIPAAEGKREIAATVGVNTTRPLVSRGAITCTRVTTTTDTGR